MQSDGRANVARDAVQHVADGEFTCARCLDDEVLLALHHGDGLGQFEDFHARMRHLGGDGLVAEVEAEAVRRGLADDAREQHGGVLECEVRELVAVAEVPQHRRARRAFAIRVRCVDRKGRRASGDEHGHGQAEAFELCPQRDHGREFRIAKRAARGGCGFLNVAIVRVQAGGTQPVRVGDQGVKFGRTFARREACAVHPAIEVEENAERHIGGLRTLAQCADVRGIIRHRADCRLRKLAREFAEAGDIWPGLRESEQHIRRSGGGAHLGLGDRGSLEFRDAQLDLPRDERAELVSLHMRPQPRRITDDLDHQPQVVLDAIAEKEEGRRGDRGFVLEAEPVVHRREQDGRAARCHFIFCAARDHGGCA